jgi:hypothetical protein
MALVTIFAGQSDSGYNPACPSSRFNAGEP